MNWSDLSMSQRSELMSIYLKNGITSLDEMKKHYNSFAEGGNTDDPPTNINVTTPLFSIQGTLPEDSSLEDRYKANDIAKGIEYAGNYFGSEGFKNRAIKANQKYGYNLYNLDDPLRIQHFPKRIHFIQNNSNANAAFNFGLSLYENPIFAGGHETGHHIPLYNTHTFGLSDDIKAQMANPNSTLYSPRYHNNYSQIPEEWRNILKPINPEDDHNAELSEAYSDLVGLRAVLKDYGIFDSDDPNAVFTQEMLDEFKKQLGSKTNRFLDYHSDENVIRAVNEIADAGQSSIGNYAAKGGKLDIPPYWGQPTNKKDSPIDYLSRYVNSQAFARRAPNQSYIKQAKNAVNNFSGVTNSQWREHSIGPHINEYNNTITMYPGRIDTPYAPYEYSFKAPYMTILAHEYGHIIDPNYGKENNVPKSYTDLYKTIIPKADSHDSRPDEIYADLQSLRYQLYENNIFDIINDGTFNESHLDKALKQGLPNRLLYTMPKEAIIQMMNTIADSGSQDDTVNTVANGGPIHIKSKNHNKLNIPPYTQFLNTLPDNLKNSGNEYNMRRYWELNNYPKDFNEGIQLGMFTKQDDGYHANSVAFNPITNSYEFMKDRNHPTYNMELDWYYSDDPEAVEFRKKYKYTPGIGMIPDQYTPRRFDNGGPLMVLPLWK